MTTKPSTDGALKGVRILDMATVFAAPLGATLCADQGAEVIKLELPGGASDALRQLQPIKDGKPLWWKVTNRGKRGITLDVRKLKGRETLLRMLPRFDVLVENFRTGTLDRWGLDIGTLHRANPRLIVIRLTGFGQTGPYSHKPGFARIFEAMSGFTSLTGEEKSSPLHSNFSIGDAVAAVFCAFSIAAEVARLRGDPDASGSEVDLAATEAMLRLLDALPVEHELLGQIRTRVGNRTSYTAPSNMYLSRDGIYFSVVASSKHTFERLCEAVGHADWVSDPRFSTNSARIQNMAMLDESLSSWFEKLRFDDIRARLEQHEIPFSKVNNISDVEANPHFQARHAIIRLPDPDYGSIPAPCIVPRIVGRAMTTPRTGPAAGEHNREVYSEFGFGEDELASLYEQGVI